MTEKTETSSDRFAHLKVIAAETTAPKKGGSADSADKKDENKADARRQWKSYYSDLQLSERFIATNQQVLFVSEYAQWRIYNEDTGVWQDATEFEVRGLVQDFLKGEYSDAKKSKTLARADEAEVCQRTFTAKRVLDWSTPTLAVSHKAFDQHKDLIVVANGIVDLRTAELKPFDAKLFLTQRIAYPYVAGAKNKHTDAALASLPADTHFQFQVMSGQALTGHQPSRSTIFFLWGDGANGKSTILDLLSATAGDYGKKPKKDVLLKGGGSSNFHTIAFKGARQALIEELPDERFLDGGVIRDLAGTTTMTGEHKGKDTEEFEVIASIFVTINNRPQVTETAHGVWRRLRLFHFPYKYVESEAERRHADHRLQDAMLKDLHKKSEQAVIAFLAWRIEGARLWYEADRKDPSDAPSVETATKAWRTMNDALQHWWDENLIADPAYFILVDDLLDDLNQWRNTPKATWGKHNLLDKFTAHSIFQEHGLEYKQAARHRDLTQSTWTRPNPAEWDKARVAKTQATFIKGVRFRTSADGVEIPDDASELTDGNLPIISEDELDSLDVFDDEEGAF